MCDETDGDDDGAGEFKVEGDNDEQGDELSGLGADCKLPLRKSDIDESGSTKGRGFGLAFGRDKRLPPLLTSLVVS